RLQLMTGEELFAFKRKSQRRLSLAAFEVELSQIDVEKSEVDLIALLCKLLAGCAEQLLGIGQLLLPQGSQPRISQSLCFFVSHAKILKPSTRLRPQKGSFIKHV